MPYTLAESNNKENEGKLWFEWVQPASLPFYP